MRSRPPRPERECNEEIFPPPLCCRLRYFHPSVIKEFRVRLTFQPYAMANHAVNVSLEVGDEYQVQDITFDGQEKYIQ